MKYPICFIPKKVLILLFTVIISERDGTAATAVFQTHGENAKASLFMMIIMRMKIIKETAMILKKIKMPIPL